VTIFFLKISVLVLRIIDVQYISLYSTLKLFIKNKNLAKIKTQLIQYKAVYNYISYHHQPRKSIL